MKKIISNIIICCCVFLFSYNILGQSLNGSFESKFKRYKKNEAFSGNETQNWNATAWKGERIHKQIVLWSNANINDLNYTVGDFRNGSEILNTSNVKLRFCKYVKGDPQARSCSEYPAHPNAVEIADVLSDVEINTLAASDPIKLWVTIDVPSETIAGVYTGTITTNGGNMSLIFNIELTVVDYTLPIVADWGFHLDLWQFPVNILNHYNTANPSNTITIWSDEHFALFEPAYRLLADSGQKAITTYVKEGALGAESMIKWIKKTNGTWEYDFTVFDKYVTALMSWGITKQIDCFSPVGWNETIIPYWDEATGTMINLSAPLGSATYNTRWDHFLTVFKTYLDGKGWFEKTILYLDEVSEVKLNSVVSVVHGNNSQWKLGIAYSHGLSNTSKANFYDLSGILEDASNDGISDNKVSTFYTSCTQTTPNSYITPDNNIAEMTWMAWHAMKEGYDGYLRWAFDYWQLSDPFDARDGSHTAGDFAMIYRDSNNSPTSFLQSLRLMNLREGIQDYEKIKVLKTSLGNSSTTYDIEALNGLNEMISNFGRATGVGAQQLVLQGQKTIEDIVLGNFSSNNDSGDSGIPNTYCDVTGTGNYNASLVSTTGGNTTNILYGADASTDNYVLSSQKIDITQGETFILSVTNSNGWSRSIVWIDWNRDGDFVDSGERLTPLSLEKTTAGTTPTYSLDIVIPNDAVVGMIKMRIVTGDAWTYEDSAIPTTPCGIPIPDGTLENAAIKDFRLEIVSSTLGLNDFNINNNIRVFPNPTSGFFSITLPNSMNEVVVKLYNIQSQLLLSSKYPVINGNIQLDISNQPTGMYFALVFLEKPFLAKLVKNN